MNNQTKTQENVKKALAKQTLGLPLTPHEHALVTLYGQSPVQQKENKPEFVEKYLKPLVVALGVGVVNVVYRKTSEHDEIVTLIYENGFTTDKDVSADSLSALTCDTISHINGRNFYKKNIYPYAPKNKLKKIVSNYSKQNGGNLKNGKRKTKSIQQRQMARNGKRGQGGGDTNSTRN